METFDKEIERKMIDHMNQDHVDAMRDYCKHNGVLAIVEEPVMLGIDQCGFDMLVNGEKIRMTFKHKCASPTQVREALVDLAQEARLAIDH